MDFILQQFINGVTVGGVYALIALGYTMVFGVLKLINFAHGDVFMVGAYLSHHFAHKTGIAEQPSVVGALGPLAFAMFGCALLGVVIERAASRPLRKSPRINAL